MIKIIYFSGVHGAGKTSIIQGLANKLRKTGFSVYVFSEFSYIPDIEIGTMEFQAWYKRQMELRKYLIGMFDWDDKADFVLVDRHPIDVDVYTNRLLKLDVADIDLNKAMDEYGDENYTAKAYKHYVVSRHVDDILHSLHGRLEDEPHRTDWDEDDREYVTHINAEFLKLTKRDDVDVLMNYSLDRAIDKVFQELVK